jgi:hypothetical protein
MQRDQVMGLAGGNAILRAYDMDNVLEYEKLGIELDLDIQDELLTFRSELTDDGNDSLASHNRHQAEGAKDAIKVSLLLTFPTNN